MDWLIAHWQDLIAVVGAALGLATLVARLTPTPRDDEVVAVVRRWLLRLSVLHPDGGAKLPGAAPKLR